jgi:hypothetical protein
MDGENDWGNKKQNYYSKNKRDNEDSDFLEEEEEAIKIQQNRLKKLKEVKLLDSESEEDYKKNEKGKSIIKRVKKYNLDSSDDEGENINSNEETEENSQILMNIKNNLEELNNNLIPTIDFVNDMKSLKKYLVAKKDMHILYTVYLLYYLNFKTQKKISDHHPILKKMLFVKGLLNGMKETDEKIFNSLEKVLKLIESNPIYDSQSESSDNKLTGKKTKNKSLLNVDLNDFVEDNKNKFKTLQKEKLIKQEKVIIIII